MELGYLLVGLFGEEEARYRFESMCGELIYEENKKLPLNETEKEELFTKVEQISKNGSIKELYDVQIGAAKVFPIKARPGDGGLDILVESNDNWIVYQCKFFLGKNLDGQRRKQIKDSFNKALATAKKHKKTITNWILCLPEDLSEKDKKFWDDFVKDRQDKVKNIDIKTKIDLNKLLNRNLDVFKSYFEKLITKESKIENANKIREYKDKMWSMYTSLVQPAKTTASLQLITNLTTTYKDIFDSNKELFTYYQDKMASVFKEFEDNARHIQTLRLRLEDLKPEFGSTDENKWERFQKVAKNVDNYIEEQHKFRDKIQEYYDYLENVAKTL